MNAASYVGRVGGLAVALGIGASIVTGQGIAVATADGDTPTDNLHTGDGSGDNTAKVNDNAPDDVGKIAVKPSRIADIIGRHRATDTTPSSVTAASIVKRLSDAAEDTVKRVTDAMENAAGAMTRGDRTTQLTTSRLGGSSSLADRRAARAERLAARTTPPSPESTDSDADTNNVVANGFVNRASAIKDWLASPPVAAGRAADTAPIVPTQSPLWTPPRILTGQGSLLTIKAASAAPLTANRAPNLLAAVLGDVFNPFAGTAPNAPTPELPLSWMLVEAVRRQLSGAAVNLRPPSLITASPTLIPNGDTITPVYPETVIGIYNMTTPPPGVNQSIQGYQPFNVVDANGNTGTFYAYVSTRPYLGTPSVNNQVLYVDSGVANLLGDSPGAGALPDGSVISIQTLGAFVNVYSAITSPDGNNVVSSILTNTITGQTIDLSPLVQGFDAAHLTPALPDYITSDVDPTVTAVSGLPPIFMVLQGYQPFEYLGANGEPIGHFNAVVTTTKDVLGIYTEALLVTGYPETGQGDAPPIGTVYNTIVLTNLTNVYSSIPQDDGTDKVTNILTNTQTGQTIDLSWLFQGDDASKGLTDGTNILSFDFGNGYTIAPSEAQEVFTGVNGLPPFHASIQGTQVFDVMHGSDSAGTFTAHVTTIPTMVLFNDAQVLLVTDSSSPAVPVGSVFDVQTYPFGFVNVYSSLVGAGANGQNLITDTLTTPWGTDIDLSWLGQGPDAAAGLNPADGLVSFANAPWLELFTNPF